MSKQPSDSFLPSGAMDSGSPHREFGPSRIDASVPRTMPECIQSPTSSRDSPKPYSQSNPHHSNGSPLSPPKTRSGSTDPSSGVHIENWRTYTQNLRTQYAGERAHMMADRARSDEVMDEERALWEEERCIFKAKIKELEVQLEKIRSYAASQHSTGLNSRVLSPSSSQSQRRTVTNSGPVSANFASPGSIDGTAAKAVPQESGRNADGSAFYAPAPRNPSRTFAGSENDNLRVGSITAPRESAIRVTSKELTSSDFLQSPPQELSSIPETPTETIDISLIQPELEGVPIKASAVSPTFAAKVLSPNSSSPAKLSPNNKSPPRDVMNLQRNSSQDKKPSTLEVMAAPENHRLTMHAGHTPNHSISKFPMFDESGNATPTQGQHAHNISMAVEDAAQEVMQGDEDPELKGTLGLSAHQTPEDAAFLAALTEKLAEEARKSEGVSSSLGGSNSETKGPGMRDRDSLGLKLSGLMDSKKDKENEVLVESPLGEKDDDYVDAKADDGPPLKLKPSFNFGRPMGSM